MTREEKIRVLRDYCNERKTCEGCPIRVEDEEGLCKEFESYTDAALNLCLSKVYMSPATDGEAASTRQMILVAAGRAVGGQRATDYGKPEDNFGAIARLWSAYTGFDFTALDVAMMMALLKIARIRSGTATEDSFVDLAGYAACAAECAQREKEEDHHD